MKLLAPEKNDLWSVEKALASIGAGDCAFGRNGEVPVTRANASIHPQDDMQNGHGKPWPYGPKFSRWEDSD